MTGNALRRLRDRRRSAQGDAAIDSEVSSEAIAAAQGAQGPEPPLRARGRTSSTCAISMRWRRRPSSIRRGGRPAGARDGRRRTWTASCAPSTAAPQCAEANAVSRGAARRCRRPGTASAATTAAGRRDELARAQHLDYTMRTALFEGHLERGCNAYGACERNIVALSIRNRALERCRARGLRLPRRFPGRLLDRSPSTTSGTSI